MVLASSKHQVFTTDHDLMTSERIYASLRHRIETDLIEYHHAYGIYFLIYVYLNILAQSQILGNSLYFKYSYRTKSLRLFDLLIIDRLSFLDLMLANSN